LAMVEFGTTNFTHDDFPMSFPKAIDWIMTTRKAAPRPAEECCTWHGTAGRLLAMPWLQASTLQSKGLLRNQNEQTENITAANITRKRIRKKATAMAATTTTTSTTASITPQTLQQHKQQQPIPI
jgi:hypothetical protein